MDVCCGCRSFCQTVSHWVMWVTMFTPMGHPSIFSHSSRSRLSRSLCSRTRAQICSMLPVTMLALSVTRHSVVGTLVTLSVCGHSVHAISAVINNAIKWDQRSVSNMPFFWLIDCAGIGLSKFLQDAGITVLPDPISVTGRILQTPSVYCRNPSTSRPGVSPRCKDKSRRIELILNPQTPRNSALNVIDETFHEPKGFSAWVIHSQW